MGGVHRPNIEVQLAHRHEPGTSSWHCHAVPAITPLPNEPPWDLDGIFRRGHLNQQTSLSSRNGPHAIALGLHVRIDCRQRVGRGAGCNLESRDHRGFLYFKGGSRSAGKMGVAAE